MGLSAPAETAGFITVSAAAADLGVSPWDVIRLVQSGELEGLVLVSAASLEAMKGKS